MRTLPLVVAGLGAQEMILILLVLLLLFGARKLPELARGSGRALRIFKAETKGLIEEDEAPIDDPRALGNRPSAAPVSTANIDRPDHLDAGR